VGATTRTTRRVGRLSCQGTGTLTVRNNLIGAGKAPLKRFIFSNGCPLARTSNNYLWSNTAAWRRRQRRHHRRREHAGRANATGDIYASNASCYDASFPRRASSSIRRGVREQGRWELRVDGTTNDARRGGAPRSVGPPRPTSARTSSP